MERKEREKERKERERNIEGWKSPESRGGVIIALGDFGSQFNALFLAAVRNLLRLLLLVRLRVVPVRLFKKSRIGMTTTFTGNCCLLTIACLYCRFHQLLTVRTKEQLQHLQSD